MCEIATPLTLDSNQKDALYKHLLSIWDIIPSDVQMRFKKAQDCVLCHNCREYLLDLQDQIRKDREIKNISVNENKEETE